MENMNVRFDCIHLQNWKNVRNGKIELFDSKDLFNLNPSILGVYGQNGSGKTTLIQIIKVIKTLLMGRKLSHDVIDLISIDKKTCNIEVYFSITNNKDEIYNIKYFVELKVKEKNSHNIDIELKLDNESMLEQRLVVNKEVLSFSHLSANEKVRMTEIINMDQEKKEIFTPTTKLKLLSGDLKESMDDLLVCKKISYETSSSFIFNSKTLDIFRKNCSDRCYLVILDNLVNFANFNLFVISNEENGLISLNFALPINFKISDSKNHQFLGTLPINLKGTTTISPDAYNTVEKCIKHLNTVLIQIIPNLIIDVDIVGTERNDKGKERIKIQLYSKKNDIKISLANESEGIKKIVSILQLLIVMFNNPSVTVAIDELDSGIFEYLLGELLRIISKHARGQLIFTSHNLRPLETIEKKYVCFTTTNSKNRYVKMINVNRNNNLRDFYFHELLLVGQKEELYDQTNNGAITLAFKEAGDIIE